MVVEHIFVKIVTQKKSSKPFFFWLFNLLILPNCCKIYLAIGGKLSALQVEGLTLCQRATQLNHFISTSTPDVVLTEQHKVEAPAFLFHNNKPSCSWRVCPTCELVVDEICEVRVVPPPEEPQLPPALPLTPPPYAQHVGLQAAAEAAQDGIFLRHREEDGRRRGTLPHKLLPFDPSQVSLQEEGEGRES